ncbi:MAG: cysteine desulfurase family protein [Lachnospiraceae bacterium]|nr:cysteine desulfurase family protein [Lachnospiraceae bacterium]
MEAYLDNSATTRVSEPVIDLVVKLMREDYGNPSSKHLKGFQAEQYMRRASEQIAATLKCSPKEILFTSGGTESNNTAIIGGATAASRRGNHIIVSSVEHSSVKEPFRALEERGFEVTWLPVDKNGIVDLDALKAALDDKTILVSCMAVNNEMGAVEPIEEIGRIVKEFNPDILYHVDAIQAYGKFRLPVHKIRCNTLSVSGHKIHAPKGTGFLYIAKGTKIQPIIYGGGQQGGMRSGTENVPGYAGLGLAAELAYGKGFDEEINRMYAMKEKFVADLKSLDGVTINGKTGRDSAPHIVSASFEGIRAEVLLHALEEKGVYVSSGSACSSNRPGLSSTLQAIGVPDTLLDSTLRFSFCFETTQEELDYCIQTLRELLPQLRLFTRH